MDRASDFVAQIQRVCPLPASVQRVVAKIDDPRSSAQEVAAAVAVDVGLSAELLRLVNSPSYGRPRGVDTVEEAVVTVGLQQLRFMAISMALLASFSSEHVCVRLLHQSGAVRGAIAGAFSSLAKVGAPTAYLAGLLAEIGALAWLAMDPPGYGALLQQTWGDPGQRRLDEISLLGATSRWVGGELLNQNGLPRPVADAVAAEDDDAMSAPFVRLVRAARFLADAPGVDRGVEAFGREGWDIDREDVQRVLDEAAGHHESLLRAAGA